MGFVPHIWPRSDRLCGESWSEWQDLNLRPPRPERGALPFTKIGADPLKVTEPLEVFDAGRGSLSYRLL